MIVESSDAMNSAAEMMMAISRERLVEGPSPLPGAAAG